MSSRPVTDAPSSAGRTATLPTCCSRPMSTISVTDAATELSLLSCSACGRHAWLKDGELLDREGMLAAVRQRLAEAPRPKGGRPKGSGKKAPAVPAPRAAAPAPARDAASAARAADMRNLLSGFRVLGDAPRD